MNKQPNSFPGDKINKEWIHSESYEDIGEYRFKRNYSIVGMETKLTEHYNLYNSEIICKLRYKSSSYHVICDNLDIVEIKICM